MKNNWKVIISFAVVAVAAAWFAGHGVSSVTAQTPSAPPTQALAAAQSLSDAFAWVADSVKPAVVSIVATKYVSMPRNFHWFFSPDMFGDQGDEDEDVPQRRGRGGQSTPRKFKQEGIGSGVLIDKDGYILTNNHVIKGTDELKVFMSDKREFDAKVVGTDPKTDLAIVKINGKNLPSVPLADSTTLRVGDWVVAIGSPYGLPQTVTAGIVSAKGRSGVLDSRGGYEDFIQTDAAINRGNSGGPLVNLQGKIVGLNTAIYSSSGGNTGVGFAVPSSIIASVLPSLKAGKPVQRGQLGVMIQDLNEDLAQQFGVKQTKGVLVAQVNKDSAAEKAGIQPGDIIAQFGGKPVEDVNELRNRVAATAPSAKSTVVVIRKGKEVTLSVTVGSASETTAAAAEEESDVTNLGVTVTNLTKELERKLDYKGEKGVVVTDVDSNSLAYRRGVREGDLIVEVNRQPVTSVSEFEKVVKNAKDSVLLLIKNKEGSRFVPLQKK
ncbi:MAG: DegQ family serine endoprotease [Verrucomicrobia bacterium]|nr:DegQ family serine endoprotease [Verrucomicrobiota bacterium]